MEKLVNEVTVRKVRTSWKSDTEIRKVKFNIRETNRNNKSKTAVPFVVKYHPLLNSLNGIIRKNLYKEVFSSQPMVSFHSVGKLSSYLVREKLYPLKRRVGSYKRRYNRCQVCRSITKTDMFIYNNDQRPYKITHCVKSVQIQSLFWSVSSPSMGKYGPEKTLYLDTFHAVTALTVMRSVWFIC